MGLIKLYRSGFTKGINPYQETQDETGMDFDILIMDDGDTFEISDKDKEIALVIIEGAGTITFEDTQLSFNRPNWVDYDPTVVHMAPSETTTISATLKTRVAIVKTINSNQFKGKIYFPDNIDTEHRGKDQLDDTCYRLVRLAFDGTITPPESKLVIGEVLNFPGSGVATRLIIILNQNYIIMNCLLNGGMVMVNLAKTYIK